MQGVGWRREEIEALVKLSRYIIFRMNHQGANSCYVGCLQSPEHCVLQESSTRSLFLPVEING